MHDPWDWMALFPNWIPMRCTAGGGLGCWWQRRVAEDHKRREELGARQGCRQHRCQPVLRQVSNEASIHRYVHPQLLRSCQLLINIYRCLFVRNICNCDVVCAGTDSLMTAKASCWATTACCFDILAERVLEDQFRSSYVALFCIVRDVTKVYCGDTYNWSIYTAYICVCVQRHLLLLLLLLLL